MYQNRFYQVNDHFWKTWKRTLLKFIMHVGYVYTFVSYLPRSSATIFYWHAMYPIKHACIFHYFHKGWGSFRSIYVVEARGIKYILWKNTVNSPDCNRSWFYFRRSSQPMKNNNPTYVVCFLGKSSIRPFFNLVAHSVTHLGYWGRNKMDTISQTTFWSAFSWMKMFEFWLKFHWSLFLRVRLTIFQHWFR